MNLQLFLNRLSRAAGRTDLGRDAMHLGAKAIQKEVKKEIGSYQGAAGQFPAWEPLADFTIGDRVEHGFSPNDPLLRTGGLRDSIEMSADDKEAHVGSDKEEAVWQELGTVKIPPRSFLGGAVIRGDKDIEKAIEHGIEEALRRIL